ncbi:LytR C-terminal domain-containing protein [Pseudoclavibacter alba]|uniref:LytR C-terminal domain-containing protein n=1 Tax=Pseudoclavibacter albus TaxID=272241 RepID=UPI0019D06D17|nr:LytR C-terminal domain-containing protein [Pseudoclavibacter alba]MBN6777363.1 LytR C-terminal domain-containing protein [Pseudoclavibacter alba]
MSNYPKDRFDDLPVDLDRRGAHRAPRSRGAKLASFLWGLAAVAVLVIIGLVAMNIIDNIVSGRAGGEQPAATETTGATPTSTPTPTSAVDPNLSLTVLNGTDIGRVAANFTATLEEKGWSVDVTDGADSSSYDTTTVYYPSDDTKAAAEQIISDIGGGEAVMSSEIAGEGQIVVVIGYDLAQG